MTDSHQQIASRLRRAIETNAFIGDSRELVIEYSGRVRAVNDRLTVSATWLKQGLLSESIGHAEEWMDAVDAARDLDLGNENFAKLSQRCKECVMEAPVVVERQAAWEISTAYVMYAEARRALNRYRGACMAGLGLEERVVSLRDACLATAKTCDQLGPTGDTVLRALTVQAAPLVEARLKELGREAGPIVQRIKQGGARPVGVLPEEENAQVGKLLERFRVIDDAVKDINQCNAEIRLDLQSDFGIRYFMELKDHRELTGLLVELERHHQQKNVTALRGTVRSIDRIAERRLVPIPADKLGLIKAARQQLAEDERRTNQQPEVAERLGRLLDDPKSTREERDKAYQELMDILQGPPPDELNKAYLARKEQDERLRKARRVRMVKIGAVGGLVAAITLVGASLLWLDRTATERANKKSAEDLVRELTGLYEKKNIRAVIKKADEEGGEDPTKSAKKLLERPELAEMRLKIAESRKAVADFDSALNKLEGCSGLERGDLDKAESVAVIVDAFEAIGEDDARAKAAIREKIDRIREGAPKARAEEARRRKSADDIDREIAAAERSPAVEGLDSLLKLYELRLQGWASSVGDKAELSRVVSKEVAADLERRHLDLRARQAELRARLAVLNVEKGSATTLAGVVKVYRDYVKVESRRQQALEESLGEVLKDGEALIAVSPLLEAMESIARSPRPASKAEAESRAKQCDRKFAGLIPGTDAGDLETLEKYCRAYADYYEMKDKDPLGIAAAESRFKLARWRNLKSVVDKFGQRHYSLDGEFRMVTEGYYSLTQSPQSNKKLESNDGFTIAHLHSLSPPVLADTGLSALADGIVGLMQEAKEFKVEPLTVNMLAAERVRTAVMSAPLKAKLLKELLTSQAASKWPQSPECAEVLARIELPGARLGDDARWTDDSTRESHKAFESWLTTGTVQSLEKVAKSESDRIMQITKRAGGHRLLGVARKAETGGVAWMKGRVGEPAKSRFRGAVFVVKSVDGKPDNSPVLRKVGEVTDAGVASWESNQAPPDGTPLIGQFQD